MSEYYVGWQERAPDGLRRHQRGIVLAVLLAAVGGGIVAATSFEPLPPAVFEFGAPRVFEGRIVADPYPSLLVPRPGSEGAVSRYLLVAPNKFGADELVAPFVGSGVSMEATLIHRDHRAVLEVVPGSVEPLEGAPASTDVPLEPERIPLGAFTVDGEIVEAKCHNGVMIPGEGIPHRACTAHCLRGGIPPVLAATDADGHPVQILLVGSDGRALGQELADLAREYVRIRGSAHRSGDWIYLEMEPTDVRRVGS